MYLFIYLSFCLPIYLSICLFASLKTQQFCETSSTFEPDNVKNEAILRDFLQKNGKLSAELTASYQMRLQFLHSICLKRCARQEKAMPGHMKCAPVMQTEDLKLQNSAHLRKSAPSCLLHSACHAKCIFAGPLQMSPCLPSLLEMLQNPHVLLTFGKAHKFLAPATQNHI